MASLDSILILLATVMILGAGILAYRKKATVIAVLFVAAGLVLLLVVVLPLERLEWNSDGTFTFETRGGRERDVSIEVQNLGRDVRPDNLEAFLIPTAYQGSVEQTGRVAVFRFLAIPEGNYHVLIRDTANPRALVLDSRTVAAQPQLQALRQFPPGAKVSGIVNGITGDPLHKVALGIDDRVVWTASDGSFEISGVPTGRHEMHILGQEQSSLLGPIDSHPVELEEKDTGDMGTLYWPNPVPHAGFYERVEVTRNDTGTASSVQYLFTGEAKTDFSTRIGRVYFFTRITGARPPTQIVHRWISATGSQDVKLSIESTNYRTMSHRYVGDSPGEWRVQVLGPNGHLLTERSFNVSH